MSPTLIVVLLSLLLGLQPVATDLYLPALPEMTLALGGTVSQAQLTLSALLFAFGLSQLVWGPISDRFGRRPVLLLGVGAYTLASLASMLVQSMEWLIAWRAVQGVAMGSAVVCARALIRDLYAGEQGARAMSKGLSGLGTIACISAPVGSLLAATWGWRAALGSLALFAVVTLLILALKLEETHKQPDRQALHPLKMARNWWHILRHRTFWAFTLLATGSYGALFTFLAASSFVLIELMGVSPMAYGLLLATMSASYISGTLLCRRLILKVGVQRTVVFGGAFSLAGGVLLVVFAAVGWHTPWTVMGPFYLVMIGHGIHQPCGQSGAVSPFPQAAGVAAALSGCLMTVAAFGMGLWLGPRMGDTMLPLAHGIAFCTAFTAFAAWVLVQRLGAARPERADEA